MADFEIKEDDRHPELSGTCVTEKGEAVALSGASVTFSMKHARTGVVKVNAQSCTIISASAGTVKYLWQTGDTDTPGAYNGEFRVTFADGRTARFPNNSHLEIVVKSKVV